MRRSPRERDPVGGAAIRENVPLLDNVWAMTSQRAIGTGTVPSLALLTVGLEHGLTGEQCRRCPSRRVIVRVPDGRYYVSISIYIRNRYVMRGVDANRRRAVSDTVPDRRLHERHHGHVPRLRPGPGGTPGPSADAGYAARTRRSTSPVPEAPHRPTTTTSR